MAVGKADSSLAEPIANARVFKSHCIQLNMDLAPQICRQVRSQGPLRHDPPSPHLSQNPQYDGGVSPVPAETVAGYLEWVNDDPNYRSVCYGSWTERGPALPTQEAVTFARRAWTRSVQGAHFCLDRRPAKFNKKAPFGTTNSVVKIVRAN